MFKKALSVFAAGVIAASAVTASLGCMTVEAGAVTRKITYTAHTTEGWIPPVVIYENSENFDIYGEPSSIGHENELVIEYDEGDSKAGGMPIVEDIKPTDVVTFSIITESGDEKILDVILNAISDGPDLTSFNISGRRLGVFRSGISVQEMIDSYNEDISEVRMLKEFKDVKITFDDVYGICAYNNMVGEACTWTITIEPGDPNSIESSKKISDLQFSSIKNKTYTGKAITPAVTVKDGDKKLVKGTDYTVSYKNNTKIGTATVTINGKGKYTGTKTIEFKIVPKKVTLKGSVSDTEAALSWKKVKGATGYEVYRSLNGGAYKKLTDVKTTKYTAKLSAGTSYKYKVRAYTVVNGKRVYGSWSKVIKA